MLTKLSANSTMFVSTLSQYVKSQRSKFHIKKQLIPREPAQSKVGCNFAILFLLAAHSLLLQACAGRYLRISLLYHRYGELRVHNTALANPYWELFANCTASSSVLNVLTHRTGPKISSFQMAMFSETSVKIVGSMKYPFCKFCGLQH